MSLGTQCGNDFGRVVISRSVAKRIVGGSSVLSFFVFCEKDIY